jgi:biotin transporter BioY
MKLINVIFILGAIVLTWLTEAKQEDKIFLTIFFSLAIGFWLMAMSGEEKQKRVDC